MVVNDTCNNFCNVTAQNAPSMNRAPWAKFTTPQRAENDREAEGDQRIGAALVEAVQNLQKDRVHHPTPE